MELIYKKSEQNEISMCADTLIKAFREEPWNEDWGILPYVPYQYENS